MSKIKWIIVHHTAFPYSQNPDQFKATNEYHRQKWNMKSSLGFYGGYNYEIAADGNVRKFREEGEETAAATGHNFDAVHICLDGEFDVELPTDAQIKSLTKLLIEVQDRHEVPLSNVVPHRTFANKTCYGSKLSDDWARNLHKLGPEEA